MKVYEFVIVVVIFVVLLVGILIGGKVKTITENTNTYSENVNDEMNYSENIVNQGVTKDEVLDFDSDEIQKIYPFTGAYPLNELVYLAKIKNIDRENLTNDFILRFGFAKVTKDDWAESYVSEDENVKIDEEILEKYIKDIFGDVEYTHTNFDNQDLGIDNSTTMLYTNKYDKKNKSYIIDLNEGDGIDESFVVEHTVTVQQYDDKIEIKINPIYVDNLGEKQDENGEYYFYYKCYASYDFKNKKFKDELTGEMKSLYKDISDSESGYNDEIQNIDLEKLETYVLTYRLNEKNNNYEFESLKFEQ